MESLAQRIYGHRAIRDCRFSNAFLKGVGAVKFLSGTRDHTLYSYIHTYIICLVLRPISPEVCVEDVSELVTGDMSEVASDLGTGE